MEPHYFTTRKTARYYLSAPPQLEQRAICYVLHGYGQLAPFFIKKFAKLRPDILFVAPEGLHRFYLQGTGGRVGATWMTREDRLQDIADYNHYLQSLSTYLEAEQPYEKRFLLGFSQGVATACRWLMHSSHSFDALINWAGAFPPDLDYRQAYEQFDRLPTYLVLGKQDEYISEEKLAEHLQFLQEQKIAVNLRRFEGPHRVDREALKAVLKELFPG